MYLSEERHHDSYSADTQTINAKFLFSLYLYFFFHLFSYFFQSKPITAASQSNGQDIFPAFFPHYFQSGTVISYNGRDIFSNFSVFFINYGRSTHYNSGIFYKWNYNGSFWQKYFYQQQTLPF